jgi:hypothetical protein
MHSGRFSLPTPSLLQSPAWFVKPSFRIIKPLTLAQIRNSRFVQLKDILDDMIRDMRIGGKMDEMKVRKYWQEMVGSYITNHTSRIYYRHGKLFVYLESSALKQELYMAREKIVVALNERLQEKLVNELIIR